MISEIELPSMDDRYNSFANSMAQASGWGAIYDGSNVVEDLRVVELKVISVSECQAYYGSSIATDNILCVETPEGKSTCHGDSGGPLVSEETGKLIGVTSFVSSFGCQAGGPAGFTRVTNYLEWIKEETGIYY